MTAGADSWCGRQEVETQRLARIGLYVIVGIVGLLALLVWVGVRSWSAVGWILVPC